MSRPNLRQKPRVSYYEPEEPSLDEYVFCDKCRDHVYEYCSIHGPLLVIPDDKVPAKTDLPSFVPRAALTIPHVFLHLARSYIPGAGIGVFSTLTLPKGVRFGPYRGQRTTEVNSMYCWQMYDKNHRPTHVVDAADANTSNWMRFVNCSRYWEEQNLVAYQYQGQLYYRTIKIIPRFTELLVFYGSAFAHLLNIDLKLYNPPAGYAQKLGAPLCKKPHIELEHQKKIQEKSENLGKVNKKHVEDKIIPTVQSSASKTVNITKASGSVQSKKQVIETNKVEIPKTKSTKDNNDKNNNLNEPAKSFTCNDCNKRFNSKPSLIWHIEIHNRIINEVYFNCSQCNYKTVTSGALERHMNFHDESRPCVCETCGYRFNTNKYLQSHINFRHSGQISKLHTCDICSYKTSVISNLKIHLNKHTGIKAYECSLCGKRFTSNNNLSIHIKTHTGEKPYNCNYCYKKFSQKSNLKTHISIHTGENPYKCSFCEKRFRFNSNLTTHVRTHTGEKPYKCSFCEKRFRSNGHLTTHVRTHTGEKPFKCSFCEKRFTCNGDLTKHVRTHTGEKPYKCSFCEKRFGQITSLKRHTRLHTGGKPYCCTICQMTFIDKANLNYHFKKHSDQ